jgi:hypothetical protein
MQLFLIPLLALAATPPSSTAEPPRSKPMTYGEYIRLPPQPSPFFVRLEKGEWNATLLDAGQFCDNLVHQELRKRDRTLKAADLVLGMQICLRAKGVAAIVEVNPDYRGP